MYVGVLFQPLLCDRIIQWIVAGRWFSSSTLISSTDKTDSYDLNEILSYTKLRNLRLIHL
jgi:hypothetical protein